MTDQQKGVITLIKSALEGKAYTLPEGFDMAEAAKTALRHKIIALVYYGAIYCGVDKTSEPMKKLFSSLIATMNVVQKQNHMQEKLYAAFEEAGIDYLPMKGSIIQPLFPKPEMRTMGDLDILIRLEQYDRIKPIMNGLGYVFSQETGHELEWNRKGLELELHKYVVSPNHNDLYHYYGSGWKFAHQDYEHPNRYYYSVEDYYVFMVMHFSRHYRTAGIGIRHIVDIWVYRMAHKDMDDDYASRELEKLGLRKFHNNILDTLNCWFLNAKINEKSRYITQVIFDSAEYGLAENRYATSILMQAQKEGSVSKVKRRRFWSLVFPGLAKMRKRYVVLEKMPVLLPVFWVVRWFSILFIRRKDLKAYRKVRRAQSDEKVEQRRQALEFVGLSFELEEKAQ